MPSKNVVLKALIGMPMDIIFEIFGYLHPLDLLQLARTTKALRTILMRRSSLSLWKHVRRAYYQMPDGPEGMSEPRYASLALDHICDGCGVSSTTYNYVHIYWNAQLKSCGKCESVLLANESNLKEFKSNLKEFKLFKKLPSWLFIHLQESKHNRHFRYSNYSLKQAQIWSQEYASLLRSSVNLKEWQCQIIEKNTLMKKHVESFNSWTLVRDREMSIERSRLIKAMNKALLVKLEELGWGEEISKMSQGEIYNMNQKFTKNCKLESFAQAWSSNGPAVLEAITARQTARIAEERRNLLYSRFVVLRDIYDEYNRGLPVDALIPSVTDVALFPPVHAIIHDERTDFIVTRQTFEDINLMQTLPSIFSDWKIRLDDELIRMAQVALSEPFTKDQLLLATTVFYCDTCHMYLFYPRILVHRCSYGFSPPWNSSGNIEFDLNLHQAATDIINILGFDPKAVTFEEMTVKNCVLQCLDCRTTRLGRMTMVWSQAIEHSKKQHHRPPSMINWNVPGHDGQLMLAQALDAKDPSRPRFMCSVCKRRETLTGLKQHLLMAHGIQNPDGRDILFHPDVIQAPSLPWVLPETD